MSKKTQYQIYVNCEKVGPKFGTQRAAKKWFQSQLRKTGKDVKFHTVADGEGFMIEDAPSRSIVQPNHPFANEPLYASWLYEIREV